MKVLLYGLNYTPELIGIGKYSGEMAEWLAGKGYDVRVVTAPPYYPEWRIREGYSAFRYQRETLNRVTVWRCPIFVPKNPTGLKRILHLGSFAISSLPVILRHVIWRPNVVLVTEPPFFCAPASWLTARLSGGKCWLHVQDFEIDAVFDLGIIPFAWMKRVVSTIESWLMRRFDVVSTISEAMLSRLHKKRVVYPVLFPNWADLSQIQFDEAGRTTFRGEFGIEDNETLCLYSGNIAVKQGLEILLEVAEMLPDCRFVICGNGAKRHNLQAKAEELCLTNMIFLSLQPLEKLPALLSAADIHLVIQKAGAADLVMPSKLTNILAIGGLALVTAEKDTELGLLSTGDKACVYRCDSENAEALINAITELKNKREFAEMLKRRAKAYAYDHISMDQVLGQWEEKMKEITS